ncbi:uncharacterized protein LOC127858396 isoform X2 [Dreissena polymorpha]|uniref:Uncharacterized protein n=1 Tax=Dreissena polymorpha TaxID=45954 RepID=A0A9D4BUZ8_DREPO|nr:uncharacterized protein LOC127858396 isoform X2 [Dreissena polymorpha]KAH3710029.1 hypothetical protein DPMN_069495 [Dreissena polymorpha]
MCVLQIVREFSSNEIDLEWIRNTYFEHLKQTCDDFPFSNDVVLKKRMFTRSGEPLPVRLAQDIYTIIEVAEGGDPYLLKPMISTAKARKSTVVRAIPDIETENQVGNGRQPGKCMCSSDICILKDQISTLQADHLILKQAMYASNELRTKETEATKDSHRSIKVQILKCNKAIKDCSDSTLSTIRKLVSVYVARITELEDRLRVLEVHPLLYDVNNQDSNAEYTGNCVLDSSVTFTAVPICVSVIGSADIRVDVSSVPVVIENQCDKPLVSEKFLMLLSRAIVPARVVSLQRQNTRRR